MDGNFRVCFCRLVVVQMSKPYFVAVFLLIQRHCRSKCWSMSPAITSAELKKSGFLSVSASFGWARKKQLTRKSPDALRTMVTVLVPPFLISRYTGIKPPFPVLATCSSHFRTTEGGSGERTKSFGDGKTQNVSSSRCHCRPQLFSTALHPRLGLRKEFVVDFCHHLLKDVFSLSCITWNAITFNADQAQTKPCILCTAWYVISTNLETTTKTTDDRYAKLITA